MIGALEAVASEAGGGVHVHADPNRGGYSSYRLGCTVLTVHADCAGPR